MSSLPRRQRRAVLAVVVVGALASIATSAIPHPSVSVDLPPVHLDVAHPSVVYKLHAHIGGSGQGLSSTLMIDPSRTSATPSRVLVSVAGNGGTTSHVFDGQENPGDYHLGCDHAPCDEDLSVRFDLLPTDQGSFPETSDWTSWTLFDVTGDDARNIRQEDVMIELVP